MSSGREIKTKIKSTQNMRKVTSALEMVSASKIRKAQDLMQASRPYARMMRRLIAHMAKATASDFKHPFLVERETVNRVGYIVVSTDRGLCGGLNSNLFRKLLTDVRGWQDQGAEVDAVAVGGKAEQLFGRTDGITLRGSVTQLGDRPRLEQVVGIIKLMLDAYREGKLDRVSVVYNDFVNTMTQQPTIQGLLPLPSAARELVAEEGAKAEGEGIAEMELNRDHDWDYIYEPDAETLLEHVLSRYVESLVYHATLENLASEHAARMIAMKSASDNADKVIEELTLSYNKARQAAITQEISEIVGGAAAV